MKFFISCLLLSFIMCENRMYDYIIVGGGASGTIASVELALKYPNATVLLLERGISDTEYAATHSLSAWPDLLISNDIKETIRYVDGVWTILGKVLSGGSAMNAGIMGQENAQFFTKAFGFNEEQNIRIKAMYQKLYDQLGHKTLQSEIGNDLIGAAEEMNLTNTGYQHGYIRLNSTFQTYSAFDMNYGTRNTTADYIRNAISRGEVPNLTVQVRSTVNRLIISDSNQISGVSVLNNGVPEIYTVRCSVLVSAGAIKSTQLLQVSGIGSQSELKEAGIPPRIIIEDVGKNYIDRILESEAMFAPLNHTVPLDPISSLSVEDGLLEERTGGGTISSAFGIVMGALFTPNLRTELNLKLFEEFILKYPRIKDCMNNAIQINILVANPTSRGYIKSLTPNIENAPEIDPNFLHTEEDKQSSIRAKKKASQYLETQHLKKWGRKQEGPSLECGLLIDFPTLVKSERTSSLHLFGGLTFGKVLENDFRVKGVDNLYVIDASVFPRATEINPYNTISAIGGFIAQEFVKAPSKSPELPIRVQIMNKQEHKYCLAIGSPIKAKICSSLEPDTLFWIQDINTGKYTTNVSANTPYILRSSYDDRNCIRHIIGGLTNREACNTNYDSQHVYFVPVDTDYYQVRFNMKSDSGPCMLKWWGSENISGFSCNFVEHERMKWKIKIIG